MPNRYIPFGEWLPDLPPVQSANQGVIEAYNVFPDAASYKHVPNLSAFSVNAIGGRCLGAVIAMDGAGDTYNIAGDVSALYLMVSATFTTATRPAGSGGAYLAVESIGWSFAQFGNLLLGVCGFDANGSQGAVIQQLSLSAAATQFTNLNVGGSGGNDIRANSIAIVRDFVVVGGVHQATSTSGAFAQRVRWSAINNPNSWTADPATLADFQDLVGDGGPVLRVIGGEYGVILQRYALWRMTFVGTPLVFQFDNVQRNIGLRAPKAAVSYQNLVFFLSDDGFYVFDGSSVTPIGRGRVDNTFYADVNPAQLHRVNAIIHPTNKTVLWAYPSGVNTDPDRILVYNWAFNRWSRITTTTEVLAHHLSAGGALTLAGFNTSHVLSRFAGSAMNATITTADMQFHDGRRTLMTNVRPIVTAPSNSPDVQIAVSARDRILPPGDAESFSSSVVPNAIGVANVLSSGRYHRVRLTTANNGSFTDILGIEVTVQQEGVR